MPPKQDKGSQKAQKGANASEKAVTRSEVNTELLPPVEHDGSVKQKTHKSTCPQANLEQQQPTQTSAPSNPNETMSQDSLHITHTPNRNSLYPDLGLSNTVRATSHIDTPRVSSWPDSTAGILRSSRIADLWNQNQQQGNRNTSSNGSPSSSQSVGTDNRPVQLVVTQTNKYPEVAIFGNEIDQNFETFIESFKSEADILEISKERQAKILPKYLSGDARETYRSIVEQNPSCKHDFDALIDHFRTALHRTMLPREDIQLHSIRQGKQTVGEYYANLCTAARSLFPVQNDATKKMLMIYFVNGLREDIKIQVMKTEDEGLQSTLETAKRAERILHAEKETGKTTKRVDFVSSVENDLDGKFDELAASITAHFSTIKDHQSKAAEHQAKVNDEHNRKLANVTKLMQQQTEAAKQTYPSYRDTDVRYRKNQSRSNNWRGNSWNVPSHNYYNDRHDQHRNGGYYGNKYNRNNYDDRRFANPAGHSNYRGNFNRSPPRYYEQPRNQSQGHRHGDRFSNPNQAQREHWSRRHDNRPVQEIRNHSNSRFHNRERDSSIDRMRGGYTLDNQPICRECNRIGHFARACPRAVQGTVSAITNTDAKIAQPECVKATKNDLLNALFEDPNLVANDDADEMISFEQSLFTELYDQQDEINLEDEDLSYCFAILYGSECSDVVEPKLAQEPKTNISLSSQIHVANEEVDQNNTRPTEVSKNKAEASSNILPIRKYQCPTFLSVVKTILACIVLHLAAILPSEVIGDLIEPNHPLLCNTRVNTRHNPSLWQYPKQLHCMNPNDTELEAQNLDLMFYKTNIVLHQSKAYLCEKRTDEVRTLLYFFNDERLKTEKTYYTTPSKRVCQQMIKEKSSPIGQLKGGKGAWTTGNKKKLNYEWCCKWHTYITENYILIETTVYKRHGAEAMESAVGDTSHCNYDDGQCVIPLNKGLVLWKPDKKVKCKYLPTRKVSGAYHNKFWVSDDKNLALSFTKNGLNSATDCEGNAISTADQGIVVSILGNLTEDLRINVDQYKISNVQDDIGEAKPLVGIINAMMQAVALELGKLSRDVFWSNYRYACENMVRMVDILTTLIQNDASRTVRYLLKNPDIYAIASSSVIEIHSCIPLEKGTYHFLPMNETCYAHPRIAFFRNGETHEAFVDPNNLVVRHSSPLTDCLLRPKVPIKVDGVVQLYNIETGALTIPEKLDRFESFGISTDIKMIELPKTIYHQASLIDWQDLSSHASLSDVVSTLTRQRRVLQELGVMDEVLGDPSIEADQAAANIVADGLFAFLSGFSASPGQIWIFIVSCIVTIALFVCCCRLTCMRNAMSKVKLQIMNKIKKSRNDDTIAAVGIELEREEETPLSGTLMPTAPPEYCECSNGDHDANQLQWDYSDCQCAAGNCGASLVDLHINGQKFKALADTGSTISILSSDTAKELRLRIEDEDHTARSLTGHKLQITGTAEVDVKIGGKVIKHSFKIIKNTLHDVLIGTDLMQELGAVTFDMKNCRMMCNGESLALGTTRSGATIQASVTLPSCMESVIVAVVDKQYEGQLVCVEPSKHLKQEGLLSRPSIIRVKDHKVKLPLANISQAPIILNGNSELASVDIINDEDSYDSEHESFESCPDDTPKIIRSSSNGESDGEDQMMSEPSSPLTTDKQPSRGAQKKHNNDHAGADKENSCRRIRRSLRARRANARYKDYVTEFSDSD